MSVHEPESAPRTSPVDAVAGLMASAALFIALVAVFYRPARVAPGAIVLALVAAGMSRRWSRLAGIAAAAAGLGWLAGMALAVLTNHPIW